MNTIIQATKSHIIQTDLAAIGQIADQAAAAHIFIEYQQSKADQTKRRHALI